MQIRHTGTWDMAKTLRPVPPFRASLFDLAYSKLRKLISICNTVLKARGKRVVVVTVLTLSPRITVFVTISTTFLGFVLGSADRIVLVVSSFDVMIQLWDLQSPRSHYTFLSPQLPYGLILIPAFMPFRLTNVFILV